MPAPAEHLERANFSAAPSRSSGSRCSGRPSPPGAVSPAVPGTCPDAPRLLDARMTEPHSFAHGARKGASLAPVAARSSRVLGTVVIGIPARRSRSPSSVSLRNTKTPPCRRGPPSPGLVTVSKSRGLESRSHAAAALAWLNTLPDAVSVAPIRRPHSSWARTGATAKDTLLDVHQPAAGNAVPDRAGAHPLGTNPAGTSPAGLNATYSGPCVLLACEQWPS